MSTWDQMVPWMKCWVNKRFLSVFIWNFPFSKLLVHDTLPQTRHVRPRSWTVSRLFSGNGTMVLHSFYLHIWHVSVNMKTRVFLQFIYIIRGGKSGKNKVTSKYKNINMMNTQMCCSVRRNILTNVTDQLRILGNLCHNRNKMVTKCALCNLWILIHDHNSAIFTIRQVKSAFLRQTNNKK